MYDLVTSNGKNMDCDQLAHSKLMKTPQFMFIGDHTSVKIFRFALIRIFAAKL